MAIQVISSAAADGDTVTPGTHQAGDTLIGVAYRTGSATFPTLAAGWAALNAGGTSLNSMVLAYKVASSAAESFGTWTNATQCACVVVRSSVNKLIAFGENIAAAMTVGSGGNVTYTGIDVSNIAETWIMAAVGHRSIDTDIESPPSGLSFRTGVVGASAGELAIHDSNGVRTSWMTTNYTLTAGTSSGCRTIVTCVHELDYAPSSGGGGIARLINGGLVRGQVL